MDTRRRTSTRRSALTAVAASAIVALTGLAAPSAVAAATPATHAAPAAPSSVSELRLPSATGAATRAVPAHARMGSCSVSMMSDL